MRDCWCRWSGRGHRDSSRAAASKLGAALKGGKLRRDLMAVMGRAAADPTSGAIEADDIDRRRRSGRASETRGGERRGARPGVCV